MQDVTAIALIRAFGMMSENLQRLHLGDSMAYTEHAFEALAIETERAIVTEVQPVISIGDLFQHLWKGGVPDGTACPPPIKKETETPCS